MNASGELIDRIPLALDVEAVLRHMGGVSGPAAAGVRADIERLRRRALEIVAPRVVLRLVAVEGIADGLVHLAGGQHFTSKKLGTLLAGAESLAVMVGTIGEALEEEVSRLFAASDYMDALALDAIGSVAVEEACQHVRSLVCRRYAAPAGLQVGPSLSPGYQYWDIRDQRVVFALVPAGDVGVSLTDSCLMVPRKSESAIVPLGRNLRVTAGEDEPPCRFCDRQNCPARTIFSNKEVR